MSNNEYPEEIYNHRLYGSYRHNSIGGKMVELAYDLGKKHALAGTGDWHNLTKAIADDEPIDWEKLDGRKVRMTNKETAIDTVMRRDDENPVYNAWGWDVDEVWSAFKRGWSGKFGWTLWLDGEIPIRKHTADELEPGTEFYGVLKTSEPEGVAPEAMLRTQAHVLHLDDYTISQMSPRHIEVVTVVGMYGQKESE